MHLSEPTVALPIEDQVLEAIISDSLPAASDLPRSGLPPSPLPPPPSGSSPPSPSYLAHRLRIPLSKLLDILADPRTRSRIAAAQELRDLDFHRREQSARDKALAALESILETTEDPIEKRRAATAILGRRANRNPFWPRTPGAGAADPLDLDEDADDNTPPRAPLPEPDRPQWCQPARSNLIRLLTRLQDNNNPRPDSGLTTLFHHKHQPKHLFGDELHEAIDDYLDDPGEEANLTNFSCAILHAPEPATNQPNPASPSALCTQHSALTEHVTLHWPTHHRTIRFHFKDGGNSNAVLWQIANIDIGPKNNSTPDSS